MNTDAPIPARLITIPLSHFCEKARWALDRINFPYHEEPHAPLFHRLATQRKDPGTVPVMLAGRNRLVDSTEILMHADDALGGGLLYPREAAHRCEVAALEEWFDTELGPHTRRWAYQHLLPQRQLLRELWSRDAPRIEARLLAVIAPLAVRLVASGYRISPASAQRSLGRIQEVFRQVDDKLRDGRRFLAAERFTAADLTFAALAAPVLLPTQCRAVQPALETVPPAMRGEILRFRDTEAGRFALRMFAEERSPRPSDLH
ncbi:MAG: glutathione S-transferase family protein [Proteobacteria bacterium]|nr:glutathione S-transferase family protein [Pseudomonadota bacterium]